MVIERSGQDSTENTVLDAILGISSWTVFSRIRLRVRSDASTNLTHIFGSQARLGLQRSLNRVSSVGCETFL